MKNLKLLFTGFLVISIAIISCSKGGPAGPAGTAGTNGNNGTNGSNGTNGTNGTNGRDSVLYSTWITLQTTEDTFTNNGSLDTVYLDTVISPVITQTILDSGVILSYVQNLFNNDGSIVNVLSYEGFLDVYYKVGFIDISSLSDISGAKFRYIIIPGSVVTQSGFFKNYTRSQIKAMDFSTATRLVNEATIKSASN